MRLLLQIFPTPKDMQGRLTGVSKLPAVCVSECLLVRPMMDCHPVLTMEAAGLVTGLVLLWFGVWILPLVLPWLGRFPPITQFPPTLQRHLV